MLFLIAAVEISRNHSITRLISFTKRFKSEINSFCIWTQDPRLDKGQIIPIRGIN
jgi:hypothetical protein